MRQLPLRPFIRWAGSKRLLLPEILPLAPERFGTYFEPFLGGGSLFLALAPERARVGDALEPLMDAWRSVRDDPAGLVERLTAWTLDKATYDTLRSQHFSDPLDRGAQFLFLNRGAYGGLWRLNLAGKFNVPWSAPKTAGSIDGANLKRISGLLTTETVSMTCGDFAEVTASAVSGDLVFLDPPYSKGRIVRPFIHYNEKLFDWEQQVRLADEAGRLSRLGAHVIVTNSTHPEIAGLYPGFRRVDIIRHNSLSARAAAGTTITERIFVSQ